MKKLWWPMVHLAIFCGIALFFSRIAMADGRKDDPAAEFQRLVDTGKLTAGKLRKLLRPGLFSVDCLFFGIIGSGGLPEDTPDSVLEAFVGALHDATPSVRENVDPVLLRWQWRPLPASVIPILVKRLECKLPEDRGQAAMLLGYVGPKALVAGAALERRLTDANPIVRVQAAIALGKIGRLGQKGTGILLDVLKELAEPDGWKRKHEEHWYYQWVPGHFAAMGENAISIVDQISRSERAVDRRYAAELLGRIVYESRRYRRFAFPQSALPILERLLTDDDEKVVIEALHVLKRLGRVKERTLPELRRCLSRRSKTIKALATEVIALYRPSSHPQIRTLEKRTFDSDWEVRKSAIRHLSKFRDQAEAVIPIIARCLADPNDEVSLAAIRGLGTLGSSQAVPHLLVVLEYAQDSARNESLHALQSVSSLDIENEKLLIDTALTHRSARMRVTLLGLITELRSSPRRPDGIRWGRVAYVLRQASRDDHPEVRAAAARHCGVLVDYLSPAVLEPLTHDPNPLVRHAAKKAMQHLQSAQ